MIKRTRSTGQSRGRVRNQVLIFRRLPGEAARAARYWAITDHRPDREGEEIQHDRTGVRARGRRRGVEQHRPDGPCEPRRRSHLADRENDVARSHEVDRVHTREAGPHVEPPTPEEVR